MWKRKKRLPDWCPVRPQLVGGGGWRQCLHSSQGTMCVEVNLGRGHVGLSAECGCEALESAYQCVAVARVLVFTVAHESLVLQFP